MTAGPASNRTRFAVVCAALFLGAGLFAACTADRSGTSAGEPSAPAPAAGPFELPKLPWSGDALDPVISAETVNFHYGKHHKAYVDNLNKLVAGKPEAGKSLDEIVAAAEPGPLFNNAAQVWNHSFYWQCLKPKGGGEPTGELAEAIKRDFGSFDKFREELSKAAVGQFGSGWAWLVLDGGKLKVTQTSNADLPMKHGQTALFTIDVWEHAYYVDYRNARAKYVDGVLKELANWDFAAANYAKAAKK
ncbi:MAG TPA: superoxide dismutase [Planctomycetota bacterium]|nr:superoxide dismutase [Planctomycetota bacterium]